MERVAPVNPAVKGKLVATMAVEAAAGPVQRDINAPMGSARFQRRQMGLIRQMAERRMGNKVQEPRPMMGLKVQLRRKMPPAQRSK
jgi:hypothetical protein